MGGMGLGPSSTKARGKSMSFFEQILTENGDINREHVGQTKQANTFSGATTTATTTMTTSTRRDLKQGQFDIRALQHKQQMAEITR